MSRICTEIDADVAVLRTRRLDHQPFVYVWLDATYVHVREHRHVVSKAVVIATGLRADGHREVLGVDVGDSENETFWREFLTGLVDRGLTGVRLVVSDAHAGLTKAIARCFQGAGWQRCRVHAMRRATRTWAVTRPRQWCGRVDACPSPAARRAVAEATNCGRTSQDAQRCRGRSGRYVGPV